MSSNISKISANPTAAGFTTAVAGIATAEGRKIDAVIVAAVTLFRVLKGDGAEAAFLAACRVVNPEIPADTTRANDIIAAAYPVLGSASQVRNMRLTGEAVDTLGTDDMDAARAIHSAIGAGASKTDVLATVKTCAEGGAAGSGIAAAFGTLKDKAAADKAAKRAAKTPGTPAATLTAGKVDAGLATIAEWLTGQTGATLTAEGRINLAVAVQHLTRLAHEAGTTVEDCDAEAIVAEAERAA